MEACLRKRIHVHLEDCPVVADEVGIAPPVFVSHDQTAARAGGLQLSQCGADTNSPLVAHAFGGCSQPFNPAVVKPSFDNHIVA